MEVRRHDLNAIRKNGRENVEFRSREETEMSILSYPRIYFKGNIAWDPCLTNNSQVYDALEADVRLPQGVTHDTFPEWSMRNTANWNYYGSHLVEFKDVRITGVSTGPTDVSIDDDIVGEQVQFSARIVDLDPYTTWNTILFGPRLEIGAEATILGGSFASRMCSRWMKRRGSGLDIAGNFGTIFQSAIEKKDLGLNNRSASKVVQQLESALSHSNCRGIAFRFCAYRTLYFQNGILNGIPHQPRDAPQLTKLLLDGQVFSNPAYSSIVGSVGLWLDAEPATCPGGRHLRPVSTLADGTTLGRCAVEVFAKSRRISLDFCNTIPEVGTTFDKMRIGNDGTLHLNAQSNAGDVVRLADIVYEAYGRPAYEQKSGIVDIDADSSHNEILVNSSDYRLSISATVGDSEVTLLEEQDIVIVADEREVYLDEGETREVEIHVLSRRQNIEGIQIKLHQYDHLKAGPERGQIRKVPLDLVVGGPNVPVDARGAAKLKLKATAPGLASLLVLPFGQGEQEPTGPSAVAFMGLEQSEAYLSVRILPFDDSLEFATKDTELTWKFMYENVFRVYDLIFPGMSVLFDMKDQNLMERLSMRIATLVSRDKFESFEYMPITRDLSNGKRRLIARWANKLAAERGAPAILLAEAAPIGSSVSKLVDRFAGPEGVMVKTTET